MIFGIPRIRRGFTIAGVPHIQWTMAEVEQINIKEDLQLQLFGKFAHGWHTWII